MESPTIGTRGEQWTEWMSDLNLVHYNTDVLATFGRDENNSHIDMMLSTQQIARQRGEPDAASLHSIRGEIRCDPGHFTREVNVQEHQNNHGRDATKTNTILLDLQNSETAVSVHRGKTEGDLLQRFRRPQTSKRVYWK